MDRLDKILASAASVPRKESKYLIKSGKVTVNGELIKNADFKTDTSANITVDGIEVIFKKHLYIMMNKPKGIISASSDKKAKTVVDLVPENLYRKNLSPVGRLDKDSTGLMILSDDGDFIHSVITPKKHVEKIYEVIVDKEVEDSAVNFFKNGVTLADGYECAPSELIIDTNDRTKTIVKITEGKYHQIKRMFGRLSIGVNELKRLSIGNLVLDDSLKAGECRELTESEISQITQTSQQ